MKIKNIDIQEQHFSVLALLAKLSKQEALLDTLLMATTGQSGVEYRNLQPRQALGRVGYCNLLDE